MEAGESPEFVAAGLGINRRTAGLFITVETVLIEAAKLAPRRNEQLAAVYAKELARGHRNRATLAIARKLVAHMMVVEKSRQYFKPLAETAAA